jgi:lipopolysaccharide export system permease protein
MRVFDRYVWREMALPFASGIAGFALVLLGNSLFELLRLVGSRGVSAWTVGALLGLQLPSVTVWALPFATLLATSLAVSRLGRDSELTALRMGGVSLRRCLWPTMLAGLAASAAAFAIGEYLAPPATAKFDRMVWRAVLTDPVPFMREGVFFAAGDQYQVYVGEIDRHARTLRDVMVYQRRQGQLPVITTARSGWWEGEVWHLEHGVSHYLDAEGMVTREERFENGDLDLGQDISQTLFSPKRPEAMSAAELRQRMSLFARSGVDVSRLTMIYQFKLALPLASLVVALLAGPLGVRFSRSGSLIGLLIAIGLAGGYRVLMDWSRVLAERGALAPTLAAWSPNLIFAVFGLWLLWREE